MRLISNQNIGNWLLAGAIFVIGHHFIPSKSQSTDLETLPGFFGEESWQEEMRKEEQTYRLDKHENDARTKYIKRYAPLAKAEMEAFKIPASIKLAQGILESNAGTSSLALSNKNHFGIKCFSRACQKGHCTNHSDDSHKDFFLKHNSVNESFRAHSQILQHPRYKHLKKAGSNYKKWAKGLAQAGYATDKRYAQKLVKIIEELQLHQFDS